MLVGGADGNAVTGGAGADRFVFDSMDDIGEAGESLALGERILDFSRAEGDQIVL